MGMVFYPELFLTHKFYTYMYVSKCVCVKVYIYIYIYECM
jgi:hypothetical protein